MAARNSKKNGAGAERFGVTLSGRGLAAVIVLFVIGLVWTFVLGVLVGRGYKPEEAVPKLAEFMPAAENATSEPARGEGGVLKPEELEFFDELQKKPEVTAEAEPARPAETKRPEPEKPGPDKDAGSPEAEEPRAEPADGPFRYLYQTAAFSKPEQAGNFRAKIEALGYSAGIETVTYGGKTWHRVLVNLKGSPEDAEALKKDLRGLGVEKPLLRGKKPL
jgi:cell division protein FtsN